MTWFIFSLFSNLLEHFLAVRFKLPYVYNEWKRLRVWVLKKKKEKKYKQKKRIKKEKRINTFCRTIETRSMHRSHFLPTWILLEWSCRSVEFHLIAFFSPPLFPPLPTIWPRRLKCQPRWIYRTWLDGRVSSTDIECTKRLSNEQERLSLNIADSRTAVFIAATRWMKAIAWKYWTVVIAAIKLDRNTRQKSVLDRFQKVH